MKVLIACEFSGVVRTKFEQVGHDVTSCDLLPSVDNSQNHVQGDVLEILNENWDLMIAHPPCTRLCNSGVRWLYSPPTKAPKECTDEEKENWISYNKEMKLNIMWRLLDEGCKFFSVLWNANIPRIAIENPIMHKHAKSKIYNYENMSQSFQPWQFATDCKHIDNQKKRICLWLKNLENLVPLNILDGSTAKSLVHLAGPGEERWKKRSYFFPSVAEAMANQWRDR